MHDITNIFSDFRSQLPTIAKPDVLRRAIESMAFRHFSADPNAIGAASLLSHVFNAGEHDFDVMTFSPEDRVYATNILKFIDYIRQGKFSGATSWQINTAPQEADCIVNHVSNWPLLKIINFALLLAIPFQHRAAIVTSIRNEGVGILEWIAHHRSMGFDQIFIYTNNNTDGSTPLLERLARNNIVRLIENVVGPEVPPQIKAYEHSTHLLPELREYKWAFYLDADEFFIPRCDPGFTLADFFAKLQKAFGDDPPSAISFNWKWFGSENAFEKTDGLLLQRFVHSIHNAHVKSLVQLDSVLSMKPLHCPIMFEDCKTVNSLFQPIAPVAQQITPTYAWGQVNHYWNKSFQEFVIKKSRGRGAVASTGMQRDYSTFFDWGLNGRRGNFDPAPEVVIKRTQAAYEELLKISGVPEDMALINELFAVRVRDIDKSENLKQIYQQRGRDDHQKVQNVGDAEVAIAKLG